MSSNRSGPPAGPFSQRSADDWEEWEDASVPSDDDGHGLFSQAPPTPKTPSQYQRFTKNTSVRVSRYSTIKLGRLKSRRRQKAQNAKAGISVITDMAAFGREAKKPDQQPAKFADSAALRALEGTRTSASVGNWNWWSKSKQQSPVASPQIGQSPQHGLSPDDRPIMIGISVPPASSYDHQNPYANPNARDHQPAPGMPKGGPVARLHNDPQPTSFWSPDTPSTIQSFTRARPASSVYSQAPFNTAPALTDMPPVPSLPKQYQKHGRLISIELSGGGDDYEADTPYTLFEEDGSPRSVVADKKTPLPLDSAVSPSRGWWDHIVTPFVDKRMSFSGKTELPKDDQVLQSPIEVCPVRLSKVEPIRAASLNKPPILCAPTPRRTPSPNSSNGPWQTSNSRVAQYISESQHNEKPVVTVTDDKESTVTTDHPPPYSPPERQEQGGGGGPIRYRAVFPPGHPLHVQFPPTPNLSPGLGATMTSQGAATQMNDLGDATPDSHDWLPARPVGTYLPPEHLVDASGRQHRVERTRRRHEKEDMIARRAGGFWRGRGCIPAGGCYGRTGREGRKRRRICLGVWSAIIAILILITVLAVVLTRPRSPREPPPSIWVNLTDFPPMPTGVLTVAGGDNTAARSSCTGPTTLWSCSLPKENHSSVAPYRANQPTVILQIQWDNSTNNAWKVPNGDPPAAITRRAPPRSLAARARAAQVQARAANSSSSSDFYPDPPPPTFGDMWFLGETTDGVVADAKAGEPAPFYISVLNSLNDTVGKTPPILQRGVDPPGGGGSTAIGNFSLDKILPPPDLAADGTPAPAVLLPRAVQQPVRLYDRGLDTEHYGFYVHFRRTIFLKSLAVPGSPSSSDADPNVPLDEDGGCRKTEASFLATWGEARMLVRIWTRKLASNTSSLVHPDGSGGVAALRRPGTMPWPVTVTLDTHGGDPMKKFVWETPMDDRLHLHPDKAKLLVNMMDAGGTYINPRSTGDAKYGGYDGGTGGCKCEWVNWVSNV